MKTFLNLTNGLLYDGPFDGFIRIQSCHCEQKNWERVIDSIDNNFLMWLALGYDVEVVDYSANKEIPRALYQGLEFIWYCCCREWGIENTAFVNGVNVTSYFTEGYNKIDRNKRRKFKYFRKFLNNPKKPKLISGRTDKDGDYKFFQELVANRFH